MDDWIKFLTQVATILTPFFVGWLALQHAKLSKEVGVVKEIGKDNSAKATKTREDVAEIKVSVDGNIKKLMEAYAVVAQKGEVVAHQSGVDAERERNQEKDRMIAAAVLASAGAVPAAIGTAETRARELVETSPRKSPEHYEEAQVFVEKDRTKPGK